MFAHALAPIDPVRRMSDMQQQRDQAQRMLDNDLALRARRIKQEQPEYLQDFILDSLQQLLLARTPMDTIARSFGVNVATIYRWKQKLNDRYRAEALNFDPMPFFGKSLKHYEALKNAGWQMYMTGDDSATKARGLEIARGAENDMHKMLHVAGFYDSIHYKPPVKNADDANADQSGSLGDLAKAFLTDLGEVEDAVVLSEEAHAGAGPA